jgi:hypothetical protein
MPYQIKKETTRIGKEYILRVNNTNIKRRSRQQFKRLEQKLKLGERYSGKN